jgi:hypothetical protein
MYATLDSAELARRFALNPYNHPGVEGAPPLCPHDYAAAKFEAEGRYAHPHGRNPYKPGTMAHDRFVRGWYAADEAFAAAYGIRIGD